MLKRMLWASSISQRITEVYRELDQAVVLCNVSCVFQFRVLPVSSLFSSSA